MILGALLLGVGAFAILQKSAAQTKYAASLLRQQQTTARVVVVEDTTPKRANSSDKAAPSPLQHKTEMTESIPDEEIVV